MPLEEKRGFSFDLNLFRDRLSDRTKLVILNSPENPTGGVIPPADIAAIAGMLRERDVMVLSDEIYSQLYYGAEAPASIASFPGMQEKTIILDGFSKTYAMTGWRLGLRGDAGVAGGRGEQVDGEFQLLYGQFHAARRHRGDCRTAGLGGRHDGGIPPPAGRILPGAGPDSGIPLRGAGRAFYAFANVTGTGIPPRNWPRTCWRKPAWRA